MARRISRKELKQDEFREAAIDFGQWLEENWASVAKWLAAVVVVVVVGLAWAGVTKKNREAKRQQLAETVQAFQLAEAEGPAGAPALEAALSDFGELASGSGATAIVAQFYRGAALFRLERLDEAAKALEAVVGSSKATPTLLATAQLMQARVHLAANRTDEAISLMTRLLDDESSVIPGDQLLLEIGRIHEDAGRSDQAFKQWQRILDDYPESAAAFEARQLLGS